MTTKNPPRERGILIWGMIQQKKQRLQQGMQDTVHLQQQGQIGQTQVRS